MLRTAAKLALVSAFATAGIAIYLFPDLVNLPRWLKANYFSALPVRAVLDGPSLGLRISLILVTFFLAQGSLAFNGAQRQRQRKSYLSIPFHFLEIPTLLTLIIAGVAYIPASLVRQYVAFLAGFSPFLTLLELCAAMTVIMASGRKWSPQITESSVAVKILVLLACLASFVGSYGVIFAIFSWMRVSTWVACLLSSIASLSFSQIVACCCVDHATITDLALMLPYIAYNLALIAFREAGNLALEARIDAPFVPKQRLLFLSLQNVFTLNLTPSGVVKEALSAVFSPILVFHLLFQLCILVVAAGVDGDDEDESETELTLFGKFLRFAIQALWPLFGKSFLVLIYTAAWLDQSHPETLSSLFKDGQLPWYLDSVCFWRWIVVFGALAWYGQHLIFDGVREDESYQCDKNFWQQFHNFK